MKKLLTLITLTIAGLFQNANAQIQETTIYGDSLAGCQNVISGYVLTGAIADAVNIEITWGDGNTNTIPMNIAANSYGDFSQAHVYTVPGDYTVDVQFYSTVNSAYFGSGEQVDVYANSQSSCGFFWGNVYQTSPPINYPDAPLDCVGADGTTTTIMLSPSSPNFGSYYTGLDPANAPYTVSVNDAWLVNNGYTQISADATITSFNATGMANPSQMTFEISCSVAATNPDFAISYGWAGNFVAPLQTGYLNISVCNYACSNSSDAHVNVGFPAGFTPNISGLTNGTISGNAFSFDILQLTDCEYVTVPFTFPGTTPAGTQICFQIDVTHPNDSDLTNNSMNTCGVVLNSYDPNAKEVNQPAQIDADLDETLQYAIHFQNDGNYNAVNVQLIDTLSANLDLSTFRVLGAKHSISYNLDPATRIVTFNFNQIYLAPSSQDLNASQGYVIYEIDEVTGLGLGDEIENTAYIYFDYNSAIITNTTYNVNTALGIKEDLKESISLYPNPTSSKFQISGTDLEEIRIFDMTGKEVQYTKLTNTNSVDVENLSNGVYTCVISSKTSVYQQKLTIKK